jgi:hypothetical protein
MARVQCSREEIDQNFQIEQAIAQLLLRGETAEISKSTLERCYTMLEHVDHGDEMTPSHRLSRQDQLVAALVDGFGINDTEYKDHGDDIQFRRKPR